MKFYKEHSFFYEMKRGVVIACLVLFATLLFMTSGLVVADGSEGGKGDVAYVLKKASKVDQGFLSAITEKGFTVDLIEDKDIQVTDFSNYDLIFVQDGRLRNAKYLDTINHN